MRVATFTTSRGGRSLPAIALLACGLLACAAGQAASVSNGSNLNGHNLNGSNLNGRGLNGVNLNGVSVNGLSINGVSVNGAHLTDHEQSNDAVEHGPPSDTDSVDCTLQLDIDLLHLTDVGIVPPANAARHNGS